MLYGYNHLIVSRLQGKLNFINTTQQILLQNSCQQLYVYIFIIIWPFASSIYSNLFFSPAAV